MWIFLNNAFLSIVEPAPLDAHGDTLLVRARFSGDITRVFPEAKVTRTDHRDYLFRAFLPRARVAEVIARNIAQIDYGNFKDSVSENWRHETYARVWGVMNREQRQRSGRAVPQYRQLRFRP